eukprot:16061656-Heterocapsa_arctica.AAC.1
MRLAWGGLWPNPVFDTAACNELLPSSVTHTHTHYCKLSRALLLHDHGLRIMLAKTVGANTNMHFPRGASAPATPVEVPSIQGPLAPHCTEFAWHRHYAMPATHLR